MVIVCGRIFHVVVIVVDVVFGVVVAVYVMVVAVLVCRSGGSYFGDARSLRYVVVVVVSVVAGWILQYCGIVLPNCYTCNL